MKTRLIGIEIMSASKNEKWDICYTAKFATENGSINSIVYEDIELDHFSYDRIAWEAIKLYIHLESHSLTKAIKSVINMTTPYDYFNI